MSDETLVREALVKAGGDLPGSPRLPHQIATWLVEAMTSLLADARVTERRACVQELYDQARWCREHGVPGRAEEYENGALWLRDPKAASEEGSKP